jgi:hypothetical protein
MLRLASMILFCSIAVLPLHGQGSLRTIETKIVPISLFDWVFLKAKVESIGLFSQIELRGFSYDSAKDQIVATAVVSPDLLTSGTISKVKSDLQTAGHVYLADVFIQIERYTAQKWPVENRFKHFSVQFKTFTKGQWQDVGVWESGAVILK